MVALTADVRGWWCRRPRDPVPPVRAWVTAPVERASPSPWANVTVGVTVTQLAFLWWGGGAAALEGLMPMVAILGIVALTLLEQVLWAAHQRGWAVQVRSAECYLWLYLMGAVCQGLPAILFLGVFSLLPVVMLTGRARAVGAAAGGLWWGWVLLWSVPWHSAAWVGLGFTLYAVLGSVVLGQRPRAVSKVTPEALPPLPPLLVSAALARPVSDTNLRHLASLGMLTAGAAHALNNALTCVLTNVEFALAPNGDLLDNQAALQDAAKAARRMRDQLGDLARLSGTSSAPQSVPMEIGGTVEAALRLARVVLKHRLVLQEHLESVPAVSVNPQALMETLVWLLCGVGQADADLGPGAMEPLGVALRACGPDVVLRLTHPAAWVGHAWKALAPDLPLPAVVAFDAVAGARCTLVLPMACAAKAA